MAIKVPDVGGNFMLNVLFGATAKATSFTVQLFTDAGVPADADINTTHEVATGGGYADKTLSNNATVAVDGSGVPTATWAAQTWTFTGPLTNAVNKTIKGYQVLAGTTLVYEEAISSPFTPTNNNDTFTLTPAIKLGNGTPA